MGWQGIEFPGSGAGGWLLCGAVVAGKAALLIAAAWLLRPLLRGMRASACHLVWVLLFGATLSLPVVQGLAPPWRIVPGIVAAPPAERLVPVPERPGLRVETDAAAAARPGLRMGHVTTSPRPSIRSDLGAATARPSWSAVLLALWGGGVVVLMLHLAWSGARLRAIVRSASPADARPWAVLTERASRSVGPSRAVRVLSTGIVRPVVVLPRVADEWSAERRRNVLLHELAHIARRDPLTGLIARVACIAYWFNPLMWLSLREMACQRERACDDAVLGAGARQSDYAEQILEVAAAFGRTPLSIAAVTMARPSSLEGRLLAILDSRRRRGRTTPRAGAAAACVSAVLLVAVASLAQQAPADAKVVRREVVIVPIADVSTIDWTADDFVRGLRSQDDDLRTKAERAIQSLPDTDAIKGSVLERLTADLSSPNERHRHAAAWQLARTRSPRVVEALVIALEDESPLVRAGAAGALGEVGDPRAVGPLQRLADDPEGRVREWSARSLGSFSGPDVVASLEKFTSDPYPPAREWAARSLGAIGDPVSLDTLEWLLEDSDSDVREWAARSLGDMQDSRSVEPLIGALSDTGSNVREWAARALASHGDRRAVEPLVQTLNDPSTDVREWAARGLGDIGDPAAIDALGARTFDPSPAVREGAARAISRIDDPAAVDSLAELLRAGPSDVQYWAARGLGERDDTASAETLRAALTDSVVEAAARAEAARALGRRQDTDSRDALLEVLSDLSDEVRRESVEALGRIGGADVPEALADAMIHDSAGSVRRRAVGALARLGRPNTLEVLTPALDDDDLSVVAQAVRAIVSVGSDAALHTILSSVVTIDEARSRAMLEALIELDTPFADEALQRALEASLPKGVPLARWVDEIRMQLDPIAYFTAKFPDEDPWIAVARGYVTRHEIDEDDALKRARQAVKRRDEFLEGKENADPARVKEWVERLKNEYLIAYLEHLVKRARQRDHDRT
jgi:HEAT repeat protein/beta-lactamase regulating signal transducer with metallopeptidase domain